MRKSLLLFSILFIGCTVYLSAQSVVNPSPERIDNLKKACEAYKDLDKAECLKMCGKEMSDREWVICCKQKSQTPTAQEKEKPCEKEVKPELPKAPKKITPPAKIKIPQKKPKEPARKSVLVAI